MQIDRIKISREVCLGGKWVGLEGTISHGEDPLKALTEIDQTINNYIQLTGVPVDIPEIKIESNGNNMKVGLFEGDIASCKDIKTLETYKLLVKNNYYLQEIYDKRLAELKE